MIRVCGPNVRALRAGPDRGRFFLPRRVHGASARRRQAFVRRTDPPPDRDQGTRTAGAADPGAARGGADPRGSPARGRRDPVERPRAGATGVRRGVSGGGGGGAGDYRAGSLAGPRRCGSDPEAGTGANWPGRRVGGPRGARGNRVITPMSRVTVLGPRRLQRAVVEAVQDLGVLHVDHVRPASEDIAPRELAEEDQATRAALEAVRTRAEGILALLPVIETSPRDTAPYANQPAAALRDRLAAVETEAQTLTRRLLEAEEEQEILRAYGRALEVLSPLLGLLEGSRTLEAVGFVIEARGPEALDALRGDLRQVTGGRIELVSRPVDDQRVGAVVAFARQDAEVVRGVLTRAGVSELRLPASVRGVPLGQAVPQLQARARTLPQEIERLRRELMELSQRSRVEVAAIATVARDAGHRFELMAQMPQSRYAFILYGWVPTRRVLAVRDRLRKRYGREVVVYDEPAPVHHAERVPILLDNPRWLRPFELFLGIFDPPKYGTFDPTIYFAIGMPLWVGLIIGDVGYGLVLLALTRWRGAKAAAGRPWLAIVGGMDFGFTMSPAVLRSAATVLSWITASTFLFGIVFGEFFGDLPGRFIHQFINPGWHPWFDRLEFITAYLYLSIGFGLAHVYLGLIMEMVTAVRH